MEAKELMKYKNWAVAGDVLNSSKYAYKILNRLTEAGYNVRGVNPKDDQGAVCKSLKEVPFEVEVLDLCIHPSKGIDIVKQAKGLGIKNVLIQPGAESEDILSFCRENEITAIEGCALVELSRLE
ncbi:CoA-binding protein [Desnuesiella massiliensis]|uniref:CoA-binding protein n=1 Tax=Desnuesiella massiliensis TaxID=1650662 RepID=UPI0006E2FB20|nr:CoA-binding protein [Desnuesiella massiliensis]